jgi:hypothetical protein
MIVVVVLVVVVLVEVDDGVVVVAGTVVDVLDVLGALDGVGAGCNGVVPTVEVVVSAAVTSSSPESPNDAIRTATNTSTVMAVNPSTTRFWGGFILRVLAHQ